MFRQMLHHLPLKEQLEHERLSPLVPLGPKLVEDMESPVRVHPSLRMPLANVPDGWEGVHRPLQEASSSAG